MQAGPWQHTSCITGLPVLDLSGSGVTCSKQDAHQVGILHLCLNLASCGPREVYEASVWPISTLFQVRKHGSGMDLGPLKRLHASLSAGLSLVAEYSGNQGRKQIVLPLNNAFRAILMVSFVHMTSYMILHVSWLCTARA